MESKPETVGDTALEAGEIDRSKDKGLENGDSLDCSKERKAEESEPQATDESCRKRKVKLESSQKVHKRKRMLVQRLKLRSLKRNNEAAGKSLQPYRPSLADLSDELLLAVLRSLPPRDVRSLGQVSSRFVNVVADHTLWVSPDFRHQRGLSCEQFCEQYLPFLGPWTTSVATRGPLLSPEPARLLPRFGDYLSSEFIGRLEMRCPELKALVLRDHRIDARDVVPYTLPRKLERLAFRRCALVGAQPGDSYFAGLDSALSHLQELELNRCPWFHSHSLMALSKCAHLRVLRITQCPGIVDSLPYISLSCRFGFKSLEVLDLRQTPVGDPEVMCFSQLQRLEELLLERPGAGTAQPVAESSDSSDDSDAEMLPGVARHDMFAHNQGRLQDCVACSSSLTEWVSDYGICCFAIALAQHNPRLRKLVVRGFSYVTNESVRYLERVHTLRYLDLTGCWVTRRAFESFAALRPDVEVVGLQWSLPEKREDALSEQLVTAAIKGQIGEVRSLLEAGAPIDGKDRDGETALHYAAYGGRADIVRCLIDTGADINARGSSGWTPLHRAAYGDRRDIVWMLIAASADIDVQDIDEGITPLHVAAGNGCVSATQALLLAGARKDIKNNEGKTPAEVADSDTSVLFSA